MTSYEAGFFAPLFAAEGRHFWFRARNRAIAALARQITEGRSARCRVLEVGCGNGNVLPALREASRGGMVVGFDLYIEGLRHARRRTNCALVRGDIRSFPFRARFDLIGLFDVIEHLPDDRELLASLHDLLEPSGKLLITVPARRSLWSYFDEVAHHQRRYDTEDLIGTLFAAGFEVEYCTPYMMAMLPLVWLRRRVAGKSRRAPSESARRAMAEGDLAIVPIVNGVLDLVLSQEAHLLKRRKRLPFGTSLVAIARSSRRDGGIATGSSFAAA